MKHLFIVNPLSDKLRGKTAPVLREIESFFGANPRLQYDIHITRWARDAVGYVRRYASNAGEIVRVHVLGGAGTVFEAVNGIIGLSNVQLAAYPMGRSNYFLRYFGEDKLHLFASIRNQVFSGVTVIDAIRCGNNYGIAHGLVGGEAAAAQDGVAMIEKTRLPSDFCYLWSVTKNVLFGSHTGKRYKVRLDGENLDGEYISMMFANTPCYGKNMNPAVDAHPNDGRMEVYLNKMMSVPKRLQTIPLYAKGQYQKTAGRVVHLTGNKMEVSSDSVMCVSVDGEAFYTSSIEYEIVPYAVDFVCPEGIDIAKLPRIYGRPEGGCVGD